MPPSWVELDSYILEDLSGGEFQPWWDTDFRDKYHIEEDPDATGHTYATRGAFGSVQLTPSGYVLSGDFQLDIRLQYGASWDASPSLDLLLAEDDSFLCAVQLEETTLQWLPNPSTPINFNKDAFVAYDRFWLRIKRVGSTITAYYYDDFDPGAGNYTFSWVAFSNPVSEAGDIYLQITDSNNAGVAEMRLQAEDGFPNSAHPNAIENAKVMDRSYHLAIKEGQGGGWCEQEGVAWAWPANQAAVIPAVDSDGYRRLLVVDRYDQVPYLLNTVDGPTGSGLVWRNKDKVDPNVAGSGTHIPTRIKRREDTGEMRHYTMDHLETHLTIEPRKPENKGAAGYDDNGLLLDQKFSARIYRNGEDAHAAEALDIPHDREIVFDRKTPGTPLQMEFLTDTSDYRIVEIEHYYTVYDVAKFPKKNSNDVSMQASLHQQSLRTPSFWLGRSSASPLQNRATARVLTVTGSSATTGPDGQAGSALVITP